MEELLILLLQGVIELAVQVLAYWPLDWPWSERDDAVSGAFGWMLLLIGLGAGAGLLANLVHPHLVIHVGWARIAMLIAGPLINGYISWRIARWRRDARSVDASPARHFWYAWAFSLGFVAIRFAYGVR